jgi:hypothetical protein
LLLALRMARLPRALALAVLALILAFSLGH